MLEDTSLIYTSLIDAPVGKPLILARVNDPDLAIRLKRIGLFEGSSIVRLEKEVLVRPVRIGGPKGDAVLAGGVTMRIIVHMDDGRKLPMAEMDPGETGHLEGLTGKQTLADVMNTLGIQPNDAIRMKRKLPPMEYIAVIESTGRVRLTLSMASKLWGTMQGRDLQFVMARTGEKFEVKSILGGAGACRMLQINGIRPGKILTLEKVAAAQCLQLAAHTPIIIASREGLRLFLDHADGRNILVRRTKNSE